MSKIPGPEMGINEIIDAFTVNSFDGKKYNPLRPSSAGKCEMELGHLYMEYKDLASYPPDQKKPSVNRLLNLGNSIENHANWEATAAFKQMPNPPQIKYKQQTVSLFRLDHGNTMIEGKIDLWLEGQDWRCIADWKSKGDKYSQFYASSWDEFIEKLLSTGAAEKFGTDAVFITDLPKFIDAQVDVFFNDNLYQLNAYANSDFIKERLGADGFCSILQYNKNDSRIREIRFMPSVEVFERVKAKYNRVAKTVEETGRVEGLNKDYVFGSMRCGFCRFKATCWPENDAMKAYFATLPKKFWAKDMDRLPKEVQDELGPLFEEYHTYTDIPKKLEKIEENIVKVLDKAKVYKVRLSSGQVYRTKRLKDGIVLRRDKE